jgi:hypothetical protein
MLTKFRVHLGILDLGRKLSTLMGTPGSRAPLILSSRSDIDGEDTAVGESVGEVGG